MSSNKHSNGHSPFPQKLKNFFRINGSANHSEKNDPSIKSEGKSSFRQSKFFPGGGRNRSTTVASEGNALDDGVNSPTAHANPYFAHQGPPALRHHDDASIPPSPPDTPSFKVDTVPGVNDQATAAGKEELARKLRRVASAPNAQGLFSGKGDGDRPATAELGKEPLVHNASTTMLSMVDGETDAMGVSVEDDLAPLQPPSLRNNPAFRRTYSSNSIKVRDVEVGPGSFDKIKLIGKGDVGKVYLVREKKSSRLYAMKGMQYHDGDVIFCLTFFSVEQTRDDQAQQDQESIGRTGNLGYEQPSIHCHLIPLLPIRGSFISMHGILQWWRILQSFTDSSRQMHTRGRC